jgi:ABC-2 type transport system permease protein
VAVSPHPLDARRHALLGRILRTKYTIANNHIAAIRHHLLIHLMVALGVLMILIGGGLIFFYWLFQALMGFEPFGPVLMERLTGLVFMAFFAMLLFSNLVITLSTTYISKEIDFYMHQPVAFSVTFTVKLVESIIYASWAFAVLSFPLFVAYGAAREVSWLFYPLVAALVLPFLIIPAGLGALITMIVSAILPARRSRALTVVFGLVMCGLSIVFVRLVGGRTMVTGAREAFDFSELLNFLDVGTSPLLPSLWLRQGVAAAADADWGGYAYWLLMLGSTALMSLQLCRWLIPALYYRGWCLTRETTTGDANGPGAALFAAVDRALVWLPPHTRAFVAKDMRTFWRDPAQWSQLIMLLGLLTLYIVNIRNAAAQSGAIDLFVDQFRNVIAFFNLGSTCFILSILTTRFVYPMLSLEGKQFWIVGLAPQRREAVVWEKYWVCVLAAVLMCVPLMLLSDIILGVEGRMMALSLVTVVIMAFGLTSLAVGLSACLPNFKEDNPARIANGLGGTLNVIFSLLYIAVVTLLLFVPARLADTGDLASSFYWQRFGAMHITAILGLNVFVIVFPMWLGLRRWRRMEF